MIFRTPQEKKCLASSRLGRDPTHSEKVATIINVQELQGYAIQLNKEGRLDDAARKAIQNRLDALGDLFGRKIT